MSGLLDELDRRQSIADILEAHFKAHPGEWLTLGELVELAGPACTSRIRCDLRLKRHLLITWNKQNGKASAYRYLPCAPLGPSADEPLRAVTLFNLSDRQERR